MRYLIVLLCLFMPSVCLADTVFLKNGFKLHGKIEPYPHNPKKVLVRFSNGGWMGIYLREIEKMEKNDKDHFEEWSTK